MAWSRTRRRSTPGLTHAITLLRAGATHAHSRSRTVRQRGWPDAPVPPRSGAVGREALFAAVEPVEDAKAPELAPDGFLVVVLDDILHRTPSFADGVALEVVSNHPGVCHSAQARASTGNAGKYTLLSPIVASPPNPLHAKPTPATHLRDTGRAAASNPRASVTRHARAANKAGWSQRVRQRHLQIDLG